MTHARHRRHLEVRHRSFLANCPALLTHLFPRNALSFWRRFSVSKSSSDHCGKLSTDTLLYVTVAMEPDDIVLAAEELRYATLALGRITGAVDVEEVLGEIFRGFCIGK